MSIAQWHFSPHSTLLNFVKFTVPLPLCHSFTKLHKETIEWEERFSAYTDTSAYHVTSTEVENHIFKHS